MSIDNLELRSEIVNTGVVYFPMTNEWQEIFAKHEFFGKKIGGLPNLEELYRYMLKFSEKYPEIRIGLYRPGLESFGLSPIAILKIGNESQKVSLRQLTCETCGWMGDTADPMIPDLYFGTPNKFDEMRRVEKFPVLPCPKCNSKLPLHPIWTEPYETDN